MCHILPFTLVPLASVLFVDGIECACAAVGEAPENTRGEKYRSYSVYETLPCEVRVRVSTTGLGCSLSCQCPEGGPDSLAFDCELYYFLQSAMHL